MTRPRRKPCNHRGKAWEGRVLRGYISYDVYWCPTCGANYNSFTKSWRYPDRAFRRSTKA